MFELADGVTGNTSGFGPEESRFEPWSANGRVLIQNVELGLFFYNTAQIF